MEIAEPAPRAMFRRDIWRLHSRENFMIRLFAATASAALLMSACSGAMPAPVAPIAPAAAPPAAGVVTVAAMNLMCGGTSFRVSFQKTQAEVINDDGTTISLPLLAPAADAEPGVATYTDGRMTFVKSGGRETSTVVRFARGRMAFQNCAIAQH